MKSISETISSNIDSWADEHLCIAHGLTVHSKEGVDLVARVSHVKCELCQKDDWHCDKNIDRLQVSLTSFVPIFFLTCKNCGNMKFINAIASKVYDGSI